MAVAVAAGLSGASSDEPPPPPTEPTKRRDAADADHSADDRSSRDSAVNGRGDLDDDRARFADDRSSPAVKKRGESLDDDFARIFVASRV